MHRDTVFVPSFGNRPARLVGRGDLLDEIADKLASPPGSRERAVILLGQRGSGKTVLLWEIADRARERGYVVASPTVAADGMLERVVEKAADDGVRYVRDSTTRLSGASLGALGFSAGVQLDRGQEPGGSPQNRLTHLARRLSGMGHGMLILVDELQANSPEVRQLVIAYQELVGEGLDVAMVMAGLPGAVSATLNDKVLTFLNRARKIELEPLAFRDVDAFFASAFEQLAVHVDAALRREASREVQGSPYLLQLIGYNVVRCADADGAVDRARLDDALLAAREDFEQDVCRTTLSALSGRDVDFLRAMAADGGEGPSRIADVSARMGVTADYAQKYRRRLLGAGVIRVESRGTLSFAVPYLGEYLAQEARG